MDIDKSHLSFFAKRLNKSLAVGNEGAGKVIDAGKDSKHLIGKIVSVSGVAPSLNINVQTHLTVLK